MNNTFSDEDPLNYLPRKRAQEFEKRRVIYDHQQPCRHLYVVIEGRVKVTKTSEDGGQMVARIVSADGVFGESALLGGACLPELAVALDRVTLMSWTADEIERQIERAPRLGLALSQLLVRQFIDLEDRFENMAAYKTPARVMLALTQLAASLGTSREDGSMRMGSLTHQTIAEYVGTSREVVTFELNRLRRLGLLRYSRQHMDIYTWAMREMLHEQGINTEQVRTARTQAAG